MDGISLTHGSPHKHIWSFMSGIYNNFPSHCPCATSSAVSAPSFVSTDYYCQSGNPYSYVQNVKYFTNDPLWDGENCGSVEKSCFRSHLPWFYKPLGYSTIDSIEMRLCCNSGTNYEDVPIGLMEIYVK